MADDAHLVDDDEDETWPCYRHPSVQTALRCLECDRGICVDCMVNAAVGIKCPDCARTSRAARAVIPTSRLVSGALAAIAVAAVAGGVFSSLRFGLFGLLIAYLLGMAVGEVARRASGGFRDPALARIAATAAALGMLALPVLAALAAADGAQAARTIAFPLLAAAAAAWGAYTRAS